MKTLLSSMVLTVLATLLLSAQTQEKHHSMDHQKHMQMMDMMKDSSMMDMMISKVAADKQMRIRMMEKMIEYTKGDSTSMVEMCKKMMEDSDMHPMMMKMMGSGMMKHDMPIHEKLKTKNEADSSHQHGH